MVALPRNLFLIKAHLYFLFYFILLFAMSVHPRSIWTFTLPFSSPSIPLPPLLFLISFQDVINSFHILSGPSKDKGEAQEKYMSHWQDPERVVAAEA